MKNKLLLLSVSATIVMPAIVVSCGTESTNKKILKKSEISNEEITSKQNEWLHSMVQKMDSENSLETKSVEKILKEFGIKVNLKGGTSSKHTIGDKFGDITSRFIPAFKKLDKKQKDKLTLESFGKLFENKSNSRFHIAKLVKITLLMAFEKSNPQYKSKTYQGNKSRKNNNSSVDLDSNKNIGPKANPRDSIIETFFNKPGELKYDDSFWNAESIYSDSSQLGRGQTFYRDLSKNDDTGFPQFNLSDWINVYDSKAKDILNDPKHKYSDESPTNYGARNWQFGKIYNNKPNEASAKEKTGNNNNGLNGIYSGSGFGWDDGRKTFDTNLIETLDNKTFDANGKQISNGWEHVSPQSREKMALGNGTREAKKAIGDLHNLRPSIQYLFNGPRENYPFGIVKGNSDSYGVDFEIGASISNPSLKVVEPRVNVRGDIARIIFYMHDRYHIKYDLGYYKLMTLWALMDPVTKEEKKLDNKIAQYMGFNNEYVTGEKHVPYDSNLIQKVVLANQNKSSSNNKLANSNS